MRHRIMLGIVVGAVTAIVPVTPFTPFSAQADTVAASFDVPATGQTMGVGLDAGIYIVKAYGTIVYDTTSFGPAYADAECTSPSAASSLDSIAHDYNLYPSPLSGWQSHRYVTYAGTDLLDLEVDSIAPEWIPSLPTPIGWDPAVGGPGVDAGCNESDHTYQYVLTSIGANHTFRIFDPDPSDNVGSLHVVITRVA